MANLKVVDQALIITSSLTNEQIERAEKYFPEALTLSHEDKHTHEDVTDFVVCSTRRDVPPSEVSQYGIAFPRSTAASQAQVTVVIPKLAADKKSCWVKDNFGKILQNLMAVEAQYASREKEFNKTYAALEANIVIE